MMPALEKLAADYANRKSVTVAQVDCSTRGGQGVCDKFGVSGYPTVKTFKKGGDKNGKDFNGARDYAGVKRYIEAHLAGPECTLEDKAGCKPGELAILEESEKMSGAARRAKLKEIEDSIKVKKIAKAFEKEVKDLTKKLELYKLGGEKPDRLIQLTSDAEFRDHCEHRTCVLVFLPPILDGGAAERNGFLNSVEGAFKKAKGDGNPLGFMWSQGGDHVEAEEKLSLQSGFPALIAVNVKKGKFGVHRGSSFDTAGISEFLGSMMSGRVPLQQLPKGFKFSQSDARDGKDGAAPGKEDL